MTKEFRERHYEEVKNQTSTGLSFPSNYEPKVYKVTYS